VADRVTQAPLAPIHDCTHSAMADSEPGWLRLRPVGFLEQIVADGSWVSRLPRGDPDALDLRSACRFEMRSCRRGAGPSVFIRAFKYLKTKEKNPLRQFGPALAGDACSKGKEMGCQSR
jgi:hypothetical protein